MNPLTTDDQRPSESVPPGPGADSTHDGRRAMAVRSRLSWLAGSTWYDRAATYAFGLYLVAAVPLLLFVLNRGQWFTWDEWYFLADRGMNVHDVLAPYNAHWTSIPVVAFRLMYRVVGLHHYWPYMAMTVTLHLAVCALIWLVMRRAGVRPWLAVTTASAFVLYGNGNEVISWAFEITFSGPIVAGLAMVVLADYAGPRRRRRDIAAITCGVLGLMTSGVFLPFIPFIAILVSLRRGRIAAAIQVVPLVVIYVTWLLIERPVAQPGSLTGRSLASIVHKVTYYTGVELRLAMESLTGRLTSQSLTLPAAGLVVVALVGIAIALSRDRPNLACSATLVPLCLFGVALLFMVLTSYWRGGSGVFGVAAARYLYIVVALALPLIGIGFEALVDRWRVAVPVVVVAALVGVPTNVRQFNTVLFSPSDFATMQQRIFGAAYSPLALKVDPKVKPVDVQPAFMLESPVGPSVGWLVSQRRAGRIPPPKPLTAQDRAWLELHLGVSIVDGEPDMTNCVVTPQGRSMTVTPRKGDILSLATTGPSPTFPAGPPTTITLMKGRGVAATTADMTVYPAAGARIAIGLDGMRLVIGSQSSSVRVCSG